MPDASLSIRPAGPADIRTIADFNIALCRETEHRELDPATVLEGVTRFVAESRRGRYFVAVLEGGVIAQTAHTHEWSDWRNGEIWWIQSVYVHPDQRGRGVFRSLFEYIKELGEADPDCCGIRLYMERDNQTARRSYVKLGLNEAGYDVMEAMF